MWRDARKHQGRTRDSVGTRRADMTKKGGAARVTAQDISRAGGMAALVDAAIKGATSGSEETMEASAARLAGLAEQNHNAHAQALFAAGAVPALVHVLARGNAAAQSFAAKALHCIASGSEEHQRAVGEAGGVEPLVRLLKAGSAKVQEDVASALASISTDAEHQRLIIEAGCIVPLVAILGTGSASAQAHAAQTLANAAACGTASQDATVKAGGVPLLIALLSVGKAAEPAAGCLARLAANNAANQVAISDAGAVAPLIALLNGRNAEAQVTAAAALSELCHGNADAQSAVARAGGIAPLLALLVARSSAPYSQAMTALAHLAHSNRENQEAIARLGGIKHIVQLLDAPNSTTSVQAAAALALMEVSSGNPPSTPAAWSHAHESARVCAGDMCVWSCACEGAVCWVCLQHAACGALRALLSASACRGSQEPAGSCCRDSLDPPRPLLATGHVRRCSEGRRAWRHRFARLTPQEYPDRPHCQSRGRGLAVRPE